MKIRTLNKEDASSYTALDPFGMMNRMLLPGYYGIGAFPEGSDSDDPSEEKEVPMGLMLCRETESRLLIEWLYVAEDFRGKGIGEGMLETAYRIAGVKGYETIGAILPALKHRNYICPVEEGYLYDRYFDQEEPMPGEWHIKIRAVMRIPAIRNNSDIGKIGEKMYTFSELTTAEKREAFSMLSKAPHVSLMYPMTDDHRGILEECSLVAKKEGRITGIALFKKVDDEVYLTAFFCRSKILASAMLIKAIWILFEEVLTGRLNIVFRDRYHEEIFTDILGEPIACRQLVAMTAMYEMDQESPVDMPDFMEALANSFSKGEE